MAMLSKHTWVMITCILINSNAGMTASPDQMYATPFDFFTWLVLSPASIIHIATCITWPLLSRLWLLHRQHAARYESEFLEDMDALGCRRPDVMTRVSEYMTEIVEYIQTIMSNNMAYESNGSVHFDTQAFRYMHLGDLPTPDGMSA
jgi:cysteinyl-tRNA synthetase